MSPPADVEPEQLATNLAAIRGEPLDAYVESAVGQVASLVSSTYGPFGNRKLIETETGGGESGLVLTRDGATILDSIDDGVGFDDPVAAFVVECADSMQRGLSDGITTTLILMDALVRRGSRLIDEGVHPGNVVLGNAIAAGRAGQVLDEMARDVGPSDRSLLRSVAATSMTIDLKADYRDRCATLVADAVDEMARVVEGEFIDTDDVKVVTRPGGGPELLRGTVIRRKPGPHVDHVPDGYDFSPSIPEPIENVGIGIVDGEIDFEATATRFGPNDLVDLRVKSAEARRTYLSELDDAIAESIADLRELGVDVLFSGPRVDRDVAYAFEAGGVTVVDEVKYPKSDVYRLARATGGSVVSHVHDFEAPHVGTAERIVERRVGDEKWTTVRGTRSHTFTAVLPSHTETGSAEVERAVNDAIDVAAVAAMDRQVIPGAGAPAMAVASDLREYAPSVASREQLAISTFADALEDLVRTLATGSGLDPIATVGTLRAAQRRHGRSVGLDLTTGEPVDALEAGIVEPRRVFSQGVETARLVAQQLLSTDALLVQFLADDDGDDSSN